MIVAMLALFVALTGTAVATTSAPSEAPRSETTRSLASSEEEVAEANRLPGLRTGPRGLRGCPVRPVRPARRSTGAKGDKATPAKQQLLGQRGSPIL